MLCALNFRICNLANHMKKTKQKTLKCKSIVKKLKTKGLIFFFHFHHVICKILNFDVWTRKHLAQASCTELTSYKIIANEARWICSTKCRNSSWVPKIALNLKDSLIATLKLISKGRYTTPSIPEIIWVKNVRAIVVCGFLMKSIWVEMGWIGCAI